MNQEKIAGLIVLTAIIGALAGYWYGYRSGNLTGYHRAQTELANTNASAGQQTRDNPVAETANPLSEIKTNPFSDLKFNPFD